MTRLYGNRPFSIDLRTLAHTEPDTANMGYWVNSPGVGGVDLDGDPMKLRADEFELGAQRLSAMYPNDPMLQHHIGRLHQLFAASWQPQAPTAWESALAVTLYGGQGPGRSRAYGGVTIDFDPRLAQTDKLRIACPFPTNQQHQQVRSESLRLRVVDDQGRDIPGAIVKSEIRPVGGAGPGKDLLVLEFDRQRLPPSSHVRWEVDVDLQESTIDADTPVPLRQLEDIPEEARPWLAPAPMIQSTHTVIVAMAARARQGASSVQDVVRGALREITAIRRNDVESWPDDFQNDALAFATTGWGECTAHANLFAALMRANGIPCRIVNGISRLTFSINMHYQNELLLPGRGWLHVEPQSTELQDIRTDMVETGVLPPEMEARGKGLLHYEGVQELSMMPMEVDEELRPLPQQARSVWLCEGLPVAGVQVPGYHGAT